jgi:uncharacterized Fe-S cluster protein YjdI
MARREGNKKAIIKAVSEKVSANILASDIGSETSISYLVSLIYKPQGYEFRHLGIDYGYGWTKDGGRTYAIKDSDLFDVLDQVSQNLCSSSRKCIKGGADVFLDLNPNYVRAWRGFMRPAQGCACIQWGSSTPRTP